MALREEMREEMTSDEAGLTVTWFWERLAADGEKVLSGEEECRRRLCLGVRAEVRGGMMGAGAEVLLMTGKCQTFVLQERHGRTNDSCGSRTRGRLSGRRLDATPVAASHRLHAAALPFNGYLAGWMDDDR